MLRTRAGAEAAEAGAGASEFDAVLVGGVLEFVRSGGAAID